MEGNKMNSTDPKQKEREHLLEKAKLQLMMRPDTMFFTTILFSMVYKWDTTIPTAAVDGRHLFINPDFFDSMSPEERLGVFVHEVLHVALDHITRGLNHDPGISNNAADYVDNLIVLDAGFVLPNGCLVDKRFVNMSYEQVYEILIKEKEESKKKSLPGNAFSDEYNRSSSKNQSGNIPGGIGKDILPPADAAEASQLKAEIADMVFKATIAAKQAGAWGSIPGAVLIELDKTLNPRLPWHVLFQNFMNNFAKEDYSWRRPNRKYLPDIIMPSAYSEAVSNIVFAVDSSGSVSDKEFGLFAQEIETVQQQLHPERITIINFDTGIKEIHEVTQDTDIIHDIKFTGRGGTRITPVLQWAKDNNPEVLVIFTDGCFAYPSEDTYPNCPILWLIHNNLNFSSKIGEVIHYEI